MNACGVRRQPLLACMIASIFVAGCGGPSGPKTISASGSITYKGQPLEFGTVTFSPVDPNVSVATSAPIVKGSYQTEKGLGVTTGDYKVVINAQRIPADLNETSKNKSKPAAKPGGDFTIPQKYTSYKTTDLDLKVSAKDRSVSKDFDLKD